MSKKKFNFKDAPARIIGNENLRIPQIEAYLAIQKHFSDSLEHAYIQLPVGCGKTGLMGVAPFALCDGRVLIVAPNLTIRATILRELDISNSDSFYLKRGVLNLPCNGPYVSELKTGANIHDCDAAHIVLANIQQFSGRNNKWYERLDRDYFDMILIDEGHHAPAQTWQKLFSYFKNSKIVSFTGTPFRSDGKAMLGRRIYAFEYTRAMVSGYISPIESVHVTPHELTFNVKGKTKQLSLEDVRKMSEHDWFSKGVALSEVCNKDIVNASIAQLKEVRKFGKNRQIIASACSVRHAGMVASLYKEHGLSTEVIYGELDEKEKKRIETLLRQGGLDVIVQVQMLGEGFDLGSLSVGAIFRPYRNLAPYIQFVGRILRLAEPEVPHSPANRVYLVSHVGLNDERWWQDFTHFDKRDQLYFHEILSDVEATTETKGGKRLTLRPFMKVVNETINEYAVKGYLKQVDKSLIDKFLQAIRGHGFDPLEFGLTEDVIKSRLSVVSDRTVPAMNLPVQPQRRREALRTRLSQEARSAADTALNRLNLKHAHRDLISHFPGKGDNNLIIGVALVQTWLNSLMGLASGERENATIEQLELGISKIPDAVDAITKVIDDKIKNKKKGMKSGKA